MIVVVLSCCPPSLRGDLTKWLFEISTGVYVGNIAARVRDSLWERIVSNVGSGRAIMAFSADNDQKFDIRVHNTEWGLEEIDGIKVMMRQGVGDTMRGGFSNASRMRRAMNPKTDRQDSCYTAVHVGYSSPSLEIGRITEVDFTTVRNGRIVERGQWREGQSDVLLKESLDAISRSERVVMYRAGRQVQFLAGSVNTRLDRERVTDVSELVKGRLHNLGDTGLESVCRNLGIDPDEGSCSGSIVRIYESLHKRYYFGIRMLKDN